MKKATRVSKKLQSALCRVTVTRRPEILGGRPAPVSLQLLDPDQPAANVEVAQAARDFFEVWFQVENSVTVFGMALAGQFVQIAHQVLAVSRHQMGNNLIVEAPIKVQVSGQIPQVQ